MATTLICLAWVVRVPLASGQLTSTVTNNSDTVATNSYFSCTAAGQGTGSSTRAAFDWAFNDASGTQAADVGGNGQSGTYSSTGVTYGVSPGGLCPRDTNSRVIALDGASGYVSGPGATAQSAPASYTVEIWFRTSVAGGKLIGFGSAMTGLSTSYDRQLYLDSSGRLVMGVQMSDGTQKTVVTAAPVNDGRWHLATGTAAPSAGIALYLDGARVGSDPTATTSQSYQGFARVGYDNLAGWPNAPTNYYFTGNLAFAAVYTYVLGDDVIISHYRAGR